MLSLWAALGGLGIGLALGLLGGGGSTLTVPLLLALGVEPRAAIALSLAVVGTTAAVAVVSHARAGNVDWRAAALRVTRMPQAWDAAEAAWGVAA